MITGGALTQNLTVGGINCIFSVRIYAPLLAPFDNLMSGIGCGSFQLRLSYVFALIVYMLLHATSDGLLRLLANRKTEI